MDNRLSIIPKYIICVDKVFNGDVSGKLHCGCFPEGRYFGGTEELILAMDGIMDMIGYPQSTVDKRSFGKGIGKMQRADRETLIAMRKFSGQELAGIEKTFVVQVKFRQNASWQGTVEIAGKSEVWEFESALQLINTMESVCVSASIATKDRKRA